MSDADWLMIIAEEDATVRDAIVDRTMEATCDTDAVIESLAAAIRLRIDCENKGALEALDRAIEFGAGLLVQSGYLRKYQDAADREAELDAALRDANL